MAQGRRRAPRRRRGRRIALVVAVAAVLLVALVGRVTGQGGTPAAGPSAAVDPAGSAASGLPSPSSSGTPSGTSSGAPDSSARLASPKVFDKSRHSTSRADSLWVVVNKQHPLSPITYAPALADVPDEYRYETTNPDSAQVGAVMLPHLLALLQAERAALPDSPLTVVSGYRSYDDQVRVYDREVANEGRQEADTVSARPGYSEHQTGLAADLAAPDAGCSLGAGLQACLGQTPGGRWLAAHCRAYGFIVRYTASDQAVTGYDVEPWHVRYVGTALTREMAKEHVDTLEQLFGVSGGPTYE